MSSQISKYSNLKRGYKKMPIMLSKCKTYQDWKQHDPNPVLLSDTGIRKLGTASNFVVHKPDPHAAKIANNPHAHT